MDVDVMWGVLSKYRPMLDEMWEEWSKKNEEKLAASRRTLDGRIMSEEEVQANDAGAVGRPAVAGMVAPNAHAAPTRAFEEGSDEELERLREIADERGVAYDKRWRSARMREELGFEEGAELPVKAEAAAAPGGAELQSGSGETASGAGGQDNPVGPGATASGAGGQNNPASTGHTGSGAGSQDNPMNQARTPVEPPPKSKR